MQLYPSGSFVMFDQTRFLHDPIDADNFLSSVYMVLHSRNDRYDDNFIQLLPLYDPRNHGGPLTDNIHDLHVEHMFRLSLKIEDDDEFVDMLKTRLGGWTGNEDQNYLILLRDVPNHPIHAKSLNLVCPRFLTDDFPVLLHFEDLFIRRYKRMTFLPPVFPQQLL